MRLLLIWQGSSDARELEAVLAALPRGGVGVQLRAPEIAAGPLLELARALRAICSRFGAPLLINDRLDVALAAGADGVHLPARSVAPSDARALFGAAGRDALVGRSCHTPHQVAEAARAGADYALFSPVWEVPGKGPAQGLAALAAAVRAAPIPVFALGGVTAENAGAAIAAGARGVACIRFVFDAHDPVASAVALWQAVTG